MCDCHDTEQEHEAWHAKELAYWAKYYGQDHGTREEKRQRLAAMAPVGRDVPEDWR
jgi:hypothetical protein